MAVSGVVSTAISLTKPFTPSTKLLLSEFYKNINLLNTIKNIFVFTCCDGHFNSFRLSRLERF